MRTDVSLRASDPILAGVVMLGVLDPEVFPFGRDLNSPRLVLSFVALCRLTDIISGANAASIVDFGQLMQVGTIEARNDCVRDLFPAYTECTSTG